LQGLASAERWKHGSGAASHVSDSPGAESSVKAARSLRAAQQRWWRS
jgi:hypothetical protein